jgi:sugar lactone lactonase YvrE
MWSRHPPFLVTRAFVAALALAAACESGTAPSNSSILSPAGAPARDPATSASAPTPSVYATGLEYPRGLAFGPDGDLYVAEAGHGGTGSTTAAQCTQVVPPVGPYTNGPSARISRIDRSGVRHTVASGFPSGKNAFGDILGVADVAFIGNTLYALSSGGGCSHGTTASPAGIARVSRDGTWSIVNDLSAWEAAHPVAHPNPADFEPDGSWYGMIARGGMLVAVEANRGEVVRADPRTGTVSRIVDVSASQGHIVPTVVAARNGALYLSNLGLFPVVPGLEKIFRISRSGELSVVADGFTAVLGLDFDRTGRLYVLESTSVPGSPTPGTGRVVRLDRGGGRTVVVTGLVLPTGIRIGPDGRLYISNKGYGPMQPGEILRVDLPSNGNRDDGNVDDEDDDGNDDDGDTTHGER